MSGEKQYNNTLEELRRLNSHPSQQPLNKELAWEKMTAMKSGKPVKSVKSGKRKLVLLFGTLTAAACLLLYLTTDFLHDTSDQRIKTIEAMQAGKPMRKSANSELNPENTRQEKLVDTDQKFTAAAKKAAAPHQNKVASPQQQTAKKLSSPVAKPSIIQINPVETAQAQSNIVAEAGQTSIIAEAPHLQQPDTAIALTKNNAVQRRPSKRIFHINELNDPDRPYTINLEKKKAVPPVAKQDRNFSIKINLSN